MGLLLILLRLCVVFSTLVTIVYFQNWQIWSAADYMNPVCTTVECQILGKLYQQNMNVINGNPCTDFYDYVCHNWIVYNSRPKEVSREIVWNVEQRLEFKALQDMKKLLERTDTPMSEDYANAKLLYKACMDRPFLLRYNSTVIRDIMKKVGEIPLLLPDNTVVPNQPSIWQIDERYIKLTGESALFDFKIQLDPNDPNEIITELKELFSPYGALDLVTEWTKLTQLKHYKAFLMKALNALVGPNQALSTGSIETQINEVIDFRNSLNSKRHTFSKKDNEAEITIKQFQLWYNGQTKFQPNTQINWLEIIRAIYKNSDERLISKITEHSKVDPNKKYFTGLASLLTRMPRRTIVNHIHLYFLERHLQLDWQMRANLEKSVTVNGAEANGDVKTESNRWVSCVIARTVKRLLDKVYVNSFFTKKDKSKVNELFEKGKELLVQQIRESIWVDPDTKMKSMQKIKKITGTLGYPDWYDTGKPIASNAEDAIASETDAHYDNELNRVVATTAYLQMPIYSPNVPYVIDYGSALNVFGHELYHAFDQDGIEYDEEGIHPGGKTWWPPSMITQHRNRSKCFHEQYEKYKTDELQKMKARTYYNITFENTLDEDISDAMGLKLSYLGFKQMLQKSNGVCPVLPGFANFGCEKLFFIAFGNSFCTSIIPAQQEVLLSNGLHSLPQIRINGAVSNMKEFSAAFGCKANDPMNPARTCDLWK